MDSIRDSKLIGSLLEVKALRDVDVAFLDLVESSLSSRSPLPLACKLILLAASEQSRYGHVCLDLADGIENVGDLFQMQGVGDEDRRILSTQIVQAFFGWSLEEMKKSLLVGGLVVESGSFNPSQPHPFVLTDEGRLYLWRYYVHEKAIKGGIARRISMGLEQSAVADAKKMLDGYFPTYPEKIDWQKAACALSIASSFSVITGGPGTGKTTTVMRLLAIMQALQIKQTGSPYSVLLVAPTGKAAARLGESIRSQRSEIVIHAPEGVHENSVRDSIPADVLTAHRALKPIRGTKRFKHNRANPLNADIVVIDEASMLDLEMFSNLLQAIPLHAKVIILGDKDQLASVEAGSVFSRLCEFAESGRTSPEVASLLTGATGVNYPGELVNSSNPAPFQSLVKLRDSYRFDANGGIGRLASIVNNVGLSETDGQRAVDEILTLSREDEAVNIITGQEADVISVAETAANEYASFLDLANKQPAAGDQGSIDQWAKEILQKRQEFQVLAALRQGPYGVEGLNEEIESILAKKGFNLDDQWYSGRPVIVTKNNYNVGLMNGDTGVVVRFTTEEGVKITRVIFLKDDGSVRYVLPSRLNAVETVFAMTVHKSQGSEFKVVLLILPDSINPVITKELIYTGITRSKKHFRLFAPSIDVLKKGMVKKTQRRSGSLF